MGGAECVPEDLTMSGSGVQLDGMKPIQCTTDFECANGKLLDQPSSTAVRVKSRPDAAVNTDLYRDRGTINLGGLKE